MLIRNRVPYLVATIVICSALNTYAQSKPAWVGDVEQTLDKGEWHTVRKRIYIEDKSKRFLSVTIQLLHDKTNATVDINIKATPRGAHEPLAGALSTYKLMKVKVIASRLPDLGDENLVVRSDSGWVNIKFRKGRVYTEVFSTSEAVAKKLAYLVAERVPNRD